MHKITYVGDGVQTEFLFAFPFFQTIDVRVALNSQVIAPGKYSIVANDNFDGGTVVFSDAPAPDMQIDIFRRIELSRVIDYQPTEKIDPEHLNQDFNFLLAAFQDLRAVDVDLNEWVNIHDNVVSFLNYTTDLIKDKISGGGALGVYNNLLAVLTGAMPHLINDYGSITESASNENLDDYGVL